MPIAPDRPRDPAAVLAAIRERCTALVVEAEDLAVPVPTARPFTVGELYAHLVGTAVDAAAGDVPDYPELGREDVVRGHVEAARGRSVTELAQEWAKAEAVLLHALDQAQLTALVVEATAREHDLRTALDRPGFRDDDGIRISLDALAAQLSERLSAAGAPPLRVTVEQWGAIVGSGNPHDCLVGDRFEFVRAMTGRRSRGQVARWSWSREPEAYYDLLSSFGELPEKEIRERDPRVPAHLADFDLTH
ncbi:hypothetical protein [Pseudonocardia sp. NPDC049154]|uniref:hypothetical protein n=1 Tax=Pseudonocardia sp. NPDC049154 TaxID=3155501 RepID=UPI0033E533A7